MRRNRKKRSKHGLRLRVFAWVVALLLALTSWGLGGTRLGLIFQLAAAVIFAVGTLWPTSFASLYRWLGPPKKPRMAGKQP